jgi:CBS domain-containing protein
MKVKEVMTRDVVTCDPRSNIADAAWKMWERDCGVLPIVSGSKVVGMITDRDIAMAVGTKDRSAREIEVAEVVPTEVHACHEDDDVETALEIMGQEQVRRLPVVDDEEALRGIVSMNDILLMTKDAGAQAGSRISSEEVLTTCRDISQHRKEVEQARTAKVPAMKASGPPESTTKRRA